uniref:Uncharacterized protein n=1 Tax=Phaeomonas parva TaxID=124430 RepID=A0A7S1U4M9_9STRA
MPLKAPEKIKTHHISDDAQDAIERMKGIFAPYIFTKSLIEWMREMRGTKPRGMAFGCDALLEWHKAGAHVDRYSWMHWRKEINDMHDLMAKLERALVEQQRVVIQLKKPGRTHVSSDIITGAAQLYEAAFIMDYLEQTIARHRGKACAKVLALDEEEALMMERAAVFLQHKCSILLAKRIVMERRAASFAGELKYQRTKHLQREAELQALVQQNREKGLAWRRRKEEERKARIRAERDAAPAWARGIDRGPSPAPPLTAGPEDPT